jgi:hypothetical protein
VLSSHKRATPLADGRGDHAGMKGRGYDFAGSKPRTQLPGEEDVAELGAAIGPHHRPIGGGVISAMSSRLRRCASDATVTIRAGAESLRRSSSKLVNRNGAR